MSYVEAIHYTSASAMLANAKAIRRRIFGAKPLPTPAPEPERVYSIEPRNVFSCRTKTMDAEHSAHVAEYRLQTALDDYLGSTEETEGQTIHPLVEKTTIDKIIRECSRYFDVPIIDLKANRRTRKIVLPRQTAMYLARIMTTWSLPVIGKRMGGRDHTTVLHAVNKIAKLRETDESISKAIDDLTAIIRGEAA